MKAVKQTERHNPPAHVGNCFSACMASIFELPIDAVPHFGRLVQEKYGENYTSYEAICYWFKCINDFLRPYGLYYSTLTPTPQDDPRIATQGYHIIEGYSPRGYRHAVVGHNGKIAHDPHPEGGGLKEIDCFGVFVSLDPRKCR